MSDDAEPAVRVLDRGDQRVEERLRRRRRRLGEQLLELVDHEQQRRAVVGQRPGARLGGCRWHRAVSWSSRLAGGFTAIAEQRRLELLERLRCRASS